MSFRTLIVQAYLKKTKKKHHCCILLETTHFHPVHSSLLDSRMLFGNFILLPLFSSVSLFIRDWFFLLLIIGYGSLTWGGSRTAICIRECRMEGYIHSIYSLYTLTSTYHHFAFPLSVEMLLLQRIFCIFCKVSSWALLYGNIPLPSSPCYMKLWSVFHFLFL